MRQDVHRRIRYRGRGRSRPQLRTGCGDGPATCRTYNPGPFLIPAGSDDTLTFIVDGAPIYVGIAAGAAVASEQFAADIITALGAARDQPT